MTSEVPTPYLEDNNRKGATHGEALFGDKEARLKERLDGLSPEGERQIAHVDAEQAVHDNQMRRGLGLTAAQQVELDDKAAHGDWDTVRVERAQAAMAAANSRETE